MPIKYRKCIHNSLLCKLSLFSAGPSVLYYRFIIHICEMHESYFTFLHFICWIFTLSETALSGVEKKTVAATVVTPPVHKRTLLRAPVLPVRQRRCYVSTFRRM